MVYDGLFFEDTHPMNKEILLASSSKYRKALFERLKIPFESFSPNIDESRHPNEKISDFVKRLSIEKAAVALARFEKHVCIGSDEVAALGDSLLGKPGNKANAIAQLKQLSGQKICFYTGVCVKADHYQGCQLSTTTVWFRNLSDTMIENYIEKEQPFESAASFKSETLGCALVERMEADDPSAIIGLPLISLCRMLEEAGVNII